MSVEVSSFGKTKDGKEAKLYKVTNAGGARAEITDFGATLVRLFIPNDKGEVKDVVLGFSDVSGYEKCTSYLGATIGPNSNRIGGCKFSIDGVEYKLANNDSGNNLHSDDDQGFHKQMFEAKVLDQGVKFTISAADMVMGFPGNKTLSVTYTLTDDNELKLEYEGVSDKKTIINMTNHSYFNLAGHDAGSKGLYDTDLMIKASKYTEIVPGAIPTGKLPDVAGTPMDFRSPKKIGKEIDADFEQMKMVHGYDHNFALDNWDGSIKLIACASCDGRTMEVYSDLPGIQFYSGNGLSPYDGKDGVKYGDRGGFCLETQYFPDNANQPSFVSSVKDAGEKYHTITVYKFV
ncbi:MAG: galactose mutarotase [Lachnospiraceae bacterium]|nr:galactose mutarotase [Lachnospiraceae bacterium]